jgi:hypothetical protein
MCYLLKSMRARGYVESGKDQKLAFRRFSSGLERKLWRICSLAADLPQKPTNPDERPNDEKKKPPDRPPEGVLALAR